jgi:NADH-quinone oxidoreductase subunit M
MHILSTIIFLPIIAALFILFLSKVKSKSVYHLALLVSFVVFALSLYIGICFDPGLNQFQFVEQVNWIGSFNII